MQRILVVLLAVAASTGNMQYRAGGPEAAIVAMFKAMYANDVKAYERVTLPDPAALDAHRRGSRE